MKTFLFFAGFLASIAGCTHTCETLRIEKKLVDGKRTEITWKCGKKTVVTTVDELPPCMTNCFKAAE